MSRPEEGAIGRSNTRVDRESPEEHSPAMCGLCVIQRNIVSTSFSGSLPEGSLLIWMFAVNKENQM